MSPWLAALIVAGAAAVAVTIKLLLRRRAPEGGWFTDSSRGASTFTVLGGMLSVVLAFVISSRSRVINTRAPRLSPSPRCMESRWSSRSRCASGCKGELICYARAVIDDEWSAMREERDSELVQSWIDRLHCEIGAVVPADPRQEAAYAQWFDQEAVRRDGRRGRLAEATALVPPLWVVLGLGATLIVSYMCAQADRRENAVIQSMTVGFVTAFLTSGLLVVAFLDRPNEGQSGSIEPAEMRHTLVLIDHGEPAPCDEHGTP